MKPMPSGAIPSWVRPVLIIIAAVTLLAAMAPPVSAHCPLCTAGAAAGVGITRALGVDDGIVGLWLGAFVAASGMWIDRLLKKRGFEYPLQTIILVGLSLVAIAVPLYSAGILTDTGIVRSLPDYPGILGLETLGLDRLFAGLVIGTVMVAALFLANDALVAGTGKRSIPYQGMVLMGFALAAGTILLWITTG